MNNKLKVLMVLASFGLCFTACTSKKAADVSSLQSSEDSVVSSLVSSENQESSSASSEVKSKKLTKAQWDAAFSKDNAVNYKMNMISTVNAATTGTTYTKTTTQEARIAGKKALLANASKEIIVFNPAESGLSEDEQEDTIDYYTFYYDSSTKDDNNVYTFKNETNGYGVATELDDVTHYEYITENDTTTQITALDSFDTFLESSVTSFADFTFEYTDITYDEDTNSYLVNEAAAKSFLSSDTSKLSTADIIFTFNDDNKVASVKLNYTYGTSIYNYEFTYTDYGTTKVEVPTEYTVCNHLKYAYTSTYDEDYHYDECKNCGSVFNVEKHTFDNTGTCTICESQPTVSYYISFGDDYCTDHVIAEYSIITDELINIAIQEFDDFDQEFIYAEDDPDEEGDPVGAITTYTDNECDLEITIKDTWTKDENCIVNETLVYSFKNVSTGKSIADDYTLEKTYSNHDYEETISAGNDCTFNHVFVCSECGNSYSEVALNHNFVLSNYDAENNTGDLKCKDCGLEVKDAVVIWDDDDSYAHEFYTAYLLDGERYSQYFIEWHTPTSEDDAECSVCGCYVRYTYDEKTYDRLATYGYHFIFNPDEEAENAFYVSGFEIDSMEEEDKEEDSDPTVYTCADCGLKIVQEYSEVTENCVRKMTFTMKIYDKNNTLINTYYYIRTEDAHEIDYENPETEVEGCTTINTYHCVNCDYTDEEVSYDHDVVTTCTVDEETGVHTYSDACTICGEEFGSWETEGHEYTLKGTFDADSHCMELQEYVCECGEIIYENNVTDFYNHSDEAFEILAVDEDTFGELTVYKCDRCGDFGYYTLTTDYEYDEVIEDNVTTLTYDGIPLVVTYTDSTENYNGNECVTLTYTTIEIKYEDETLYTNKYLTNVNIEHTEDCGKTEVLTNGSETIYEYDCGLYGSEYNWDDEEDWSD